MRLFTLCGEDALDVQLFANEGLITADARGYPDVSWCEGSQETASVLRAKLGRVRRSYFGRLEDLAKGGTFAKWFPFDMVNLDFTSRPFPRSQPPFNSTWDVVKSVLQEQSRNQTGFELFLTFNADRDPANEEAVHQLVNVVEDNFSSREWAREAFLETADGASPADLSCQEYDKFLLLALPKFLARLAADESMSVSNLGRFAYERRPPFRRAYRIVKFVLSLDPMPDPEARIDAPAQHEIAAESYEELVRHSFGSMGVNVDVELGDDVREQLKEEVDGLIAAARPA